MTAINESDVSNEAQKTITPPELSALEKLQAEYNQLVARLGHNIAQQMSLKTEEESLRSQVVKVTNKATNLAKPKEEAKAEVVNGNS